MAFWWKAFANLGVNSSLYGQSPHTGIPHSSKTSQCMVTVIWYWYSTIPNYSLHGEWPVTDILLTAWGTGIPQNYLQHSHCHQLLVFLIPVKLLTVWSLSPGTGIPHPSLLRSLDTDRSGSPDSTHWVIGRSNTDGRITVKARKLNVYLNRRICAAWNIIF